MGKTSRNLQFNRSRKFKNLRAQGLGSLLGFGQITEMCEQVTNVASEGADCFKTLNSAMESVKNLFSEEAGLLSKTASIISATTLLHQSHKNSTAIIAYLVNVGSTLGLTG